MGLYERLTLEAFQSGLSWLTMLRKRENFRRAFDGFDPGRVAAYGPADVERLLNDPGIIRNRSKIDAAIHNAAVVAGLGADFAAIFAPLRATGPAAARHPGRGARLRPRNRSPWPVSSRFTASASSAPPRRTR